MIEEMTEELKKKLKEIDEELEIRYAEHRQAQIALNRKTKQIDNLETLFSRQFMKFDELYSLYNLQHRGMDMHGFRIRAKRIKERQEKGEH